MDKVTTPAEDESPPVLQCDNDILISHKQKEPRLENTIRPDGPTKDEASPSESRSIRKCTLDINSEDVVYESNPSHLHLSITPSQPPFDLENNSTRPGTLPRSYSNPNLSHAVETSEVIIIKDADNNEVTLPPPQQIPQTGEIETEVKSCIRPCKIDKSEISSAGSSDSIAEELFVNSNRSPNDSSMEFLCLSLAESKATPHIFYEPDESNKMVKVKSDFGERRLKHSSSLLLTVQVSDSYLKHDLDSSDSSSSLYYEIQRKLLFELDDFEAQDGSDTTFALQKDSVIATKVYDKKFRVAWKMADLYTRCKKTTVVTPIPLTGTAMFTQRISFCKRFCRRLRSSSFSFCFCCIGNSTVDGMTRQESIEAFHNEIRGLGVEERPEGNVAQKRRGNLISATKSMKLVQKLHNCDKPTQRRVPD